MRVRPFPFEELEQVPRPFMRIVNELIANVDITDMGANLESLAEELEDNLGRLRVDFEGIEPSEKTEITPQTFVVQIRTPKQNKAYIILEAQTVQSLMRRLKMEETRNIEMARNTVADFSGALYILLKLLRGLKNLGLGPIEVDSSPPHPSLVEQVRKRADSLTFTWIVSAEWGDGLFRILADSLFWNEFRFRRKPVEWGRKLPNLVCRAKLWLGSQTLKEVEFHQLEVGDILFLQQELPLELPWPLRLRLDRGDLAMTLREEERDDEKVWVAEVNDPISIQEFEMSDPEKTAALNLSAVQVDVLMGRVSLSVDELARLGAGSIIELDRLMGEPVELLVNDQVFGRGELVNVEGRVGVRIISKGR